MKYHMVHHYHRHQGTSPYYVYKDGVTLITWPVGHHSTRVWHRHRFCDGIRRDVESNHSLDPALCIRFFHPAPRPGVVNDAISLNARPPTLLVHKHVVNAEVVRRQRSRFFECASTDVVCAIIFQDVCLYLREAAEVAERHLGRKIASLQFLCT